MGDQGEETERDTVDREDTATGRSLVVLQENTDQSSEEDLDVVAVLAGAVENFLLHSRYLSYSSKIVLDHDLGCACKCVH